MRGSVNARFRVRFSPPGSIEGRVGRFPMQAAGDHQVQHQHRDRLICSSTPRAAGCPLGRPAPTPRPCRGEACLAPAREEITRSQHQPEVAIQANGDTLSHSPQFAHSSSRGFRERRRGGSKKKRAYKPHAFERPPHHARFERRNVSRDIRQFGHTSPACMAPAGFARHLPGGLAAGSGTDPVPVSMTGENGFPQPGRQIEAACLQPGERRGEIGEQANDIGSLQHT